MTLIAWLFGGYMNKFSFSLIQAHTTSLYTTSVCTGSIILASAGLLDGLEATTHWSCYGDLSKLGAILTEKRVVKQVIEYDGCAWSSD